MPGFAGGGRALLGNARQGNNPVDGPNIFKEIYIAGWEAGANTVIMSDVMRDSYTKGGEVTQDMTQGLCEMNKTKEKK